jgi:glyoxylase-like metal-dependent hydrolase (beta-lactamase superfamily II)
MKACPERSEGMRDEEREMDSASRLQPSTFKVEPVAILPDLYQLTIPTPFPVGPVNVYVARAPGDDGLTLVDCGPRTPEARAALDAGLAALGRSVNDVRRIVVTHAHADHYGLAASLAAESGAQVLSHRFNRPTLQTSTKESERRLAFYGDLLRESGVPGELVGAIDHVRRSVGDYADPVHVTCDLNDGDTLALAGCVWQVLHTPGHSTGLICLYDPCSHVLLSNDHLLRDISSNPLVEPPPPGASQRRRSLVEYIGQMQRVAAMDVSVAWPGHGEPIHDVGELVRQRVTFHAQRAERILGLFDGGPLTAFQVARRVFPQLDPLNFFLAMSEVLGHLELLESEGRVSATRRDGVVVWQGTT